MQMLRLIPEMMIQIPIGWTDGSMQRLSLEKKGETGSGVRQGDRLCSGGANLHRIARAPNQQIRSISEAFRDCLCSEFRKGQGKERSAVNRACGRGRGES